MLLEEERHESRRRYGLALLQDLRSGVLAPLPRELKLPIALHSGERCYYCTGMCLYQAVDFTSYSERDRSGGLAAEWVPIRTWHEVKRYDAGMVAVTASRFLFAGERTTLNLYLDEIVALRREPHEDGSLVAVSTCTLPRPLFFGYVDYLRGKLDSSGEVFNSALQLTVQQLVQRRARMAS